MAGLGPPEARVMLTGRIRTHKRQIRRTGGLALAWPGLAWPWPWPWPGLGLASQRLGCTMTLTLLPYFNVGICIA